MEVRYSFPYESFAEAAADPELHAELQSLPLIPSAELKSRFLAFRPRTSHSDRAHRLSPAVKTTIAHVMAAPGDTLESAALLTALTQDQRWSALDALQEDGDHHAASGLARAMLRREPAGENRDLLTLLVARDLWMARAGESAFADERLTAAMASPYESVRREADLWSRAVGEPDDRESFELGFETWQVLQYRLMHREKAWFLSRRLLKKAPDVISAFAADPAADDLTVGRLAAALCVVAYQNMDRGALEWARDVLDALPEADPVDVLTPDFFVGYMKYAAGKYGEALEAFEEVFFSGLPSEQSSIAGLMTAECFLHLESEVGAMVALDLLFELYPDRTNEIEKAGNRLSFLQRRGRVSDELVRAFIDVRYGARLEEVRQKARQLREAASRPGLP